MAESGPQKASEPDPDASRHSTAEEENPATGEPAARETSPIPEATSYDARSYHSHSSASGSSGFFQGPY